MNLFYAYFSLLFLLAVVLMAPQGQAAIHWESELSAGGRTFPAGGSVDFEIGPAWLFWGQKPKEIRTVSDSFYGFTRAFIFGGGAGEYTESGFGIEVFPISWFGVRAKKTWVGNYDDYSDFDCEAYICRGAFVKEQLEGLLTMGLWRFFIQGSFAKIKAQSRDALDNEYIEPVSGLVLFGDRESQLDRIRGTLGFKISETWILSALYLQFKNESKKLTLDDEAIVEKNSEMKTLNIHYKSANWHVLFGAGEYRSELHNTDPTVLANVSWFW